VVGGTAGTVTDSEGKFSLNSQSNYLMWLKFPVLGLFQNK
jgi:hypothetical protein